MRNYPSQGFYHQQRPPPVHPQPKHPLPKPEQTRPKKYWLWVIISVLIIVIGLIIFYFLSVHSKTISDNELLQGINFQLKENKEVKIILNDEKHTLKVNSIGENSVNLILQSSPVQFNIKVGEVKKFDLNDDGFYDLQIKLNAIIKSVPEIYLKKIYESSCVEDWNCEEWDECSKQGIQTRTCVDLNNCGTTINKPSTIQNCTYVCIEDWNCTAWSVCINEKQIRNCTDLNSCGTNKNKPIEEKSCTLNLFDCGVNVLSEENMDNMPSFDCFINASETCMPAKLLNTITMDLFGFLATATTLMELRGMESEKCIYYQRTENNSVEFSEELVQQMLNEGLTQEEINQQEQTSNEYAQQVIGIELSCKFVQEDLTAMLNRWREGNFSSGAFCTLKSDGTSDCTFTGDFENAECE